MGDADRQNRRLLKDCPALRCGNKSPSSPVLWTKIHFSKEKEMKTAHAVILGIVLLSMAVPAASSGSRVDVAVVPDRGNEYTLIPFREFGAGSTLTFKKYLEARNGESYGILIRNHLPERIGVVIAVDGRNIITGKKSVLGSGEMMYIIGPYGQARLEGWRTSDKMVNRFYFTGSADSYAAKTFGDTSAMGVIAVAAFREKERPDVLYEQRLSGNAAAPSAPRSEEKQAQKDEAGTGFGNEHYSPVTRVEFEPEHYPFEKILIRYAWREELCRKRILHCRPEAGNRLWDMDEYAPYPPGYRSN